jgi:broad specificity phosphatase PhoE
VILEALKGGAVGEVLAEHGVTKKQALAGILPPDAEDRTSVARRSLRCLSSYLNRDSASGILFVSHDAVMQSIAERLCGRWFDNHHGTPYRFAQTGDVWTVIEVGWNSTTR